MHRSAIALLTVFALGGIGMVIWASQVETSYSESLLLNAGIAIVLFAALYLAQRYVLDRQVKDVRESVAETRNAINDLREEVNISIADLGVELDRRREAENAADDELLSEFRLNPTSDRLRALLDRALQLNAVSASGPRAWIPDTTYYLRVKRADSNGIQVRIEDGAGNQFESIEWRSELTAADILVAFRSWLNAHTTFPNANMQPVLETIAQTIEVGIGARTRRGTAPTDLAPIIERVGPTWAITDYGIEAIGGHRYPIEASRLNEPDWYVHVSGKSWADEDEFLDALRTAEDLFGISPPSRS